MNVSPQQYAQAMRALCDDARMTPENWARQCILFMRRKRLFKKRAAIIAALKSADDYAHGRVRIDGYVAHPTTPEMHAHIMTYLTPLFPAQNVVLTLHQDAAVLGGVRLIAGDTMIDASVRARLAHLAHKIRISNK